MRLPIERPAKTAITTEGKRGRGQPREGNMEENIPEGPGAC